MKNLLIVIMVGLSVSVANADTVIKVGAGAGPMENIFLKIKDAFESANSGIKLDIKKIEPVTGLKGLDKGDFDMVCVGSALKDWIAQASKAGYSVKDQSAYAVKIIGRDSLVLVVSKDTKITKLETEQLVNLFSGKVTNWKQVGGADLPVSWIHGTNTPGMDNRIKKGLSLEELKVDKTVSVLSKEIADTVAKTSGAVAYGPKALSTKGGLQEVELVVDFSSPITSLTMGEPKQEIKKLYDFIAGEGSKHIVK